VKPSPSPLRGMTLTQKILAAHAIGLAPQPGPDGQPRPQVQTGDVLRIAVDWTIASELAWNGMDKTYAALGRPPLPRPDRFFLAVDHTVDPTTLLRDSRTQKLVQLSKNFAKEGRIRHFYDSNQTILHTKFYRDLVLPGQVVIGADSHTSSHGGMGAFAIGLGGADVTAALVLGESWIEVPEAIRLEYTGALPFGMSGKEVILKTLGTLGRNTVALERSVEYGGPAARYFSTDMRFTIANMTAEFGGLNGIFEPDGIVAAWLASRSEQTAAELAEARYFRADDDAPYVARYGIDLSQLEPLLAKPVSPDNVAPVREHLGMPVDGVFIGACTTTEEELVLGGLLLEAALAAGETIRHPEARRLVVPGDLSIQGRLYAAGLWRAYEQCGFRIDPPGCSMCLGVASQRAEKGETWLSSQNRNYPNRMGEGSLAYLASAATVAATALGMEVRDPRPLLARIDPARLAKILGQEVGRIPEVAFRVSEPSPVATTDSVSAGSPASAGGASPVQSGESSLLSGRVQRFGDHVDTDAIIPGQFCHLTDLADLGSHSFEFVRPGFPARVAEGQNIVVAGEGWGSGSSREQAVWALRGAGVRAVIAKSYAFIHKRNLVNEALAFLLVSDPAFYEVCKEDDALQVDLATGRILHVGSGQTFQAQAPSPLITALTREGGLVPAIRHHGKAVFSALTGS
jgi:3-isopropylmalate dehydratase small subunit